MVLFVRQFYNFIMEKQTQRKKRAPFILLGIVLLLMAAAGVFYWISGAAFETTDDAQIDGNIYSVRAGVTAYLKTITFEDHQRVQKGDTLFIFDTIALQAQVQQAQAALENAKTKWSVSDIEALASRQDAAASHQTALSGQQRIAAAAARLKQAQSDFNRDEALLKIKAVTQVQYEADQSELAQARAAYERVVHEQRSARMASSGLRSKAQAARQQISAAAAEVAQYAAQVRLAKAQLAHAFVCAPCNGIVTKRAVDEGQYVLSGQSLCAVVDEQHLWVTAHFKETQLQDIQPGQPVQIQVDAYPDLEMKGVVRSYGGATGAKFALIPVDNATGNFIKVTQRFPLRIAIVSLPERDKGTGGLAGGRKKDLRLFPGLSVFVKVKTN